MNLQHVQVESAGRKHLSIIPKRSARIHHLKKVKQKEKMMKRQKMKKEI